MLERFVTFYFGQIVRRLRQDAGLTQEELGEKAGLQRNYISSLELGQKQPSLLTVFKISAALSIRPDDLIKKIVDDLPADHRC
jgi:transcriptional regulator with XRE-family HTH domain